MGRGRQSGLSWRESFEEQIERYSEKIKHGSKIIDLESAQNGIKAMKNDIPEAKMADLESRAESYFNAYKQILEDSYQAGLIDRETRDRFINDDYSPRVFINKMFENTDPKVFENMGLGEDQIKSIKNGSEGEMFLDTRFLLNASLRSLEKRAKIMPRLPIEKTVMVAARKPES